MTSGDKGSSHLELTLPVLNMDVTFRCRNQRESANGYPYALIYHEAHMHMVYQADGPYSASACEYREYHPKRPCRGMHFGRLVAPRAED